MRIRNPLVVSAWLVLSVAAHAQVSQSLTDELSRWSVFHNAQEAGRQAAAADLPADPVRDAFAKSFAEEAKLNYRAAIDPLLALDDESRKSYFVNLRLGWLHYLKGDYAVATRYYDDAVRAAPQATEARVGQLLPLLAEKRFAEAIQAARNVLTLESGNYFATLRLSFALRSTGELDEAERINQEMLESRPTDLSFLAEQGLVHVAKKDPDAARKTFETLLLLDPNNALARQQLGLPAPKPAEVKPETSPVTEPLVDHPQRPTSITFTLTPSLAYLDYGSGSIKESGRAAGLYALLSGVSTLELSADYTHLDYRSGAILDQEDFTVIYSYLEIPNWKFRVGGRLIQSTDPFGDDSWILLGGAHYYQTDAWDAGVDVYHSHYEDATFSLDVNQITSHVAVEHRFHDALKLRLDGLGYYINVGSDIGLGKPNFYSLETRLRLESDRFAGGFYAWTGQQTFAVRRDGFIVYNLGEEHRGGYGGELSYRFADRTWFTLRATEEIFADFVTRIGTHQFVLAGLLSHTF